MDFEQIRPPTEPDQVNKLVKNKTVMDTLKSALDQKLKVKQEDEDNEFNEYTNLDEYIEKQTGKNVVTLHKRKVVKPQIDSTNLL
jgi:hypothetical protein